MGGLYSIASSALTCFLTFPLSFLFFFFLLLGVNPLEFRYWHKRGSASIRDIPRCLILGGYTSFDDAAVAKRIDLYTSRCYQYTNRCRLTLTKEKRCLGDVGDTLE